MAQPQGGFYFKLDQMSGRFLPAVNGSPGDQTVCVTGSYNQEEAYRALNAGAAVPVPVAGKWTVDYTALMLAIDGGTRAELTPWTF
jgi:hypothetical protein